MCDVYIDMCIYIDMYLKTYVYLYTPVCIDMRVFICMYADPCMLKSVFVGNNTWVSIVSRSLSLGVRKRKGGTTRARKKTRERKNEAYMVAKTHRMP